MQQAPAMHENASKGGTQEQDFYIEQYYVTCLSEFSYYVESNGEALIIDPLREPEPYLKILEQRKAKLRYVFETHIHADFVSGHVDLAKATGATIVYGPTAKTGFEIKSTTDGELIPLGKINIRVDHTPGHTPESSCFVLLTPEGKEYCVFSGDTLFLGDVGRPDLATKSDVTKEDLAGMLYDSLRNKVMKLSQECIVYPAHGAGSACGKAISSGSSCTIGKQLQSNYALQPLSKEEFVKIVSSNIPKPPQYFFHDVAMNRNGPDSLESVLQKNMKPLAFRDFMQHIEEGAVLIDSREKLDEGVIDNALNIQITGQFATWAGTLIKPTQQLVLLSDDGKEEQSIMRLARIGYHNVLGYLEGGFGTYCKEGGKFGQVTLTDVKQFIDTKGDPENHVFVDCRQPGEWQNGIYPGAICVSLSELSDNLDKIPENKILHIYCRSGARAKTAMSIIRNSGRGRDFVLTSKDGIDAIAKENNINLAPKV